MIKFIKSPLTRLSFGLVMVTISVLLVSDMLGMIPDTKKSELQSRKVIAESLAIQLSTAISAKMQNTVEEILRAIVNRNENILSAGIRNAQGQLLFDIGNHLTRWTLKPNDRSTTTQVQVPIFNEQGRWGTAELKFTTSNEIVFWKSSFLAVLLLVAISGFIGYLLFLKRSLRELDPGAVIPDRVRIALDTLSEGLLIIDHHGVIMFSNEAFARKTGLTPEALVGKESTSLAWRMVDEQAGTQKLPWFSLLDGEELQGNSIVKLITGANKARTFSVNATPIASTEDDIRGALVTFDDVTEVEEKNDELQRTLGSFEKSQREIKRQNQELLLLATRDPLTNVLNRRSLFQGFDTLFTEACEEEQNLACIMVDIDHFKLVNDNFGHSVGDDVIKYLAKTLTDFSRPNDLVGRFGGEEFCLALPGADKNAAFDVAERMRIAIEKGQGANFSNAIKITSSFGITDITGDAKNVAELVEQADKALYEAKESGRNRVVQWSKTMFAEELIDTSEKIIDEADSHTSQEASQPESIHENIDKNTSLTFDNLETDSRKETGSKTLEDVTNYQSNRALLFDRLDQAIIRAKRHAMSVAVMTIDIERLQQIYETLGFSIGEIFAKNTISRMRGMIRDTDTVSLLDSDELLFSLSRLDGNEIVLLLTDLENTDMVTIIMQRIFASINEPIEVDGTEIFLDANIGLSIFPVDGDEPDTLLSQASSAMREAKKNTGRNNFQYYSSDINRRSKNQIKVETDMHHALQRNEFFLHYQPKIDLVTGLYSGMEALLRWQHPQLGIISPLDFIPIAEQSGLIERISQYILKMVCRQIQLWQDSGFGIQKVAINLSSVEFRNSNLADQIITQLDDAGLPTSAIELEITESAVIQNIDLAANILTQLSDAGVKITLDDFGTGFSSLSYLKKFPLSKVKIDRSFITDCVKKTNDMTIVSAIIAMAHSLAMLVIAEGVEAEDQFNLLQDLQCDEAQGFFISKPIPADETNDFLSRYTNTKRKIINNNYTVKKNTSTQKSNDIFGVLNKYEQDIAAILK